MTSISIYNTQIEWKDGDIWKILNVRNIGDKNEEAQIQMIYERYDQVKQRSLPTAYIDIPREHAQKFIDAVNKEE